MSLHILVTFMFYNTVRLAHCKNDQYFLNQGRFATQQKQKMHWDMGSRSAKGATEPPDFRIA